MLGIEARFVGFDKEGDVVLQSMEGETFFGTWDPDFELVFVEEENGWRTFQHQGGNVLWEVVWDSEDECWVVL